MTIQNLVPFKKQRFIRTESVERYFFLTDVDDDDLFFKSGPGMKVARLQRCHEQDEVNVRGTEIILMALVQRTVRVFFSILDIQYHNSTP